jgi:hypothetical protein
MFLKADQKIENFRRSSNKAALPVCKGFPSGAGCLKTIIA